MSPSDTEPLVRFHNPMPKGYVFVRKGDVYITKHCRLKTKEAGKRVYVVIDAKKKPIGLRVPSSIYTEVLELHEDTREARQSSVEKKDLKLESKARETLLRLFPKIPEISIQPVLEHTLKKRSGRVGRSTTRPFDECIVLAVHAHIRHTYTDYDSLWRQGDMDWKKARDQVQERVNEVLIKWGGAARDKTPLTRPSSQNNSIKSNTRRNRVNSTRLTRARSRRASRVSQRSETTTSNHTEKGL